MSITPLDTPWDLEPGPAPLRILTLEPDCDPAHKEPRAITIAYKRVRYSVSLEKPTSFLVHLGASLRSYDPDLVLTSWGDTWLFPFLMKICKESGIRLPLNRDETQAVLERKERTYFSYGQIVYRGRQVQLRGRWHLDCQNSMLAQYKHPCHQGPPFTNIRLAPF